MNRTHKKPHNILYAEGILFKTSPRSNDVCAPYKRKSFCALSEGGKCNTEVLVNYACRLHKQDGTTLFCTRVLKLREYR